ncbi:MAG: Holliday junction branch migration protein RuvA [Paramuribaculum sp.]|nr:Holliday junction branch migration protein RuvA [Candidatus Amulumruptor sp.]MDE6545983.1 Holliday junction branch migration protein RuvA [Paramuribaculum sp.]MDE6587084.1 Holliday junction branch migration protein RuvA [Paramuribaculum sp.]MDE7150665.1 Holliday junction branch migration protein RuvA [Candidatus Amulumruptor sp.]MDE7236901.1 Holliday junction branch migration protein RuvA [Paramuribaculum sp.]
MIEYITGRLTQLTPTFAVVEAAGVGYHIEISLTTFTQLEQAVDTDVKLLVYEIIREDTHDLFGFAEEGERTLFAALIGVSGVGANTARMILSSIKPADLEQVIASGDVRRLKAVKGIGAKTAERIIVDLRDKIKLVAAKTDNVIAAGRQSSANYDEALAALVMLGFTRQQSQKALDKLFASDPAMTVETAIKRSFTMM